MSFPKNLLFAILSWFLILFPSAILLELVFGFWIRPFDPWVHAYRLNIVVDQVLHIDTSNVYGEETPSIIYSRNQYGLRDNCESPEEIEILTVGGSTTDQKYISDGETFQDRLQTLLSRELSRKVCVSNSGVDGHSTFGHILAFENWFPLIPHLKPKFVFLYIGINDAGFRDAPKIGFDIPPSRGLKGWKYSINERSALFKMLWIANSAIRSFTNSKVRAYAGHQVVKPAISDYQADSLSKGASQLIVKNTESFSKRLSKLLDQTKQMGSIPVCISQPHWMVLESNGQKKGLSKAFKYKGQTYNGHDYTVSIEALNEVMKAKCRAHAGYYLDIAHQVFKPSEFYDVVHMNAKGSKRLGEYLFQQMRTHEMLKEL